MASSFRDFATFAEVLGVKMKAKKAQDPQPSQKVLGVQLDIQSDAIVLAPHPDRVLKIKQALQPSLVHDYLPPDEAQRLAGKLVFLNSTMFGQLGRAALRPFYGRAYGLGTGDTAHHLNVPLRHAAKFLLTLLQTSHPDESRWKFPHRLPYCTPTPSSSWMGSAGSLALKESPPGGMSSSAPR